jgi:hypothetical protein
MNKHITLQFFYTFFFCLPKRRSKKREPRCPGPSDSHALLTIGGTLKTRPPEAGSNKSSVFNPPTVAMLSATEWGPENKKAIVFKMPFHAAEQRSKIWINDSEKRQQLSEASVLCEQRRAVPLCGTK